METSIRHTFPDSNGAEWTVAATEVAPGLLIYEIPSGLNPESGLRWTVGHHSGRALAVAMFEDDARNGVLKASAVADWTLTVDEVRTQVLSERGAADALYRELALAACHHPSERAHT